MAAPGGVRLPVEGLSARPARRGPWWSAPWRAVGAVQASWSASHTGRVWTRYGRAGGGVLAAGAAYFAFFSLVPALAIGFTVLGLVVGGRADLQSDVVGYLNDNLGTKLVSLHTNEGALVALDELTGAGALSATGLFGGVGLLLTGLGWAGSMRQGIRSVFGVRGGTNPVVDRLRDVLLMVTLGIAVLVSVALSLSVTTLADQVQGWLGIEQTAAGSRLLQIGATGLVLGVDALVLVVFFRVMAGTSPRWRDLVQGAVLGAVGLGLLKLFGGLLLGRTSSSRFLTAFAVVVGLLIWMNLAARIVLIAAAWAADRSQRGVLPPSLLAPGEADAVAEQPRGALLPIGRGAAAAVGSGPDGSGGAERADRPDRSDQPALPGADAVSVAAGAVLGFTAGLGLRAVREAVRSLRGRR